MKKMNYLLVASAVYLIFTLTNTGHSQSISDVVKQEKKRKADMKARSKVYTNEDLERTKQTGLVSTGTLPSEENPIKGKESDGTEAESKDTGIDSYGWLSGAKGYEKALREHQRTRKSLVLYFYTDWCGYCRRFNSNILASYEFKQYMKNVISVRINPETGINESTIAGQYGITGYPSFFMVPAGSNQPLRIQPYVQQEGKWVAMTPSVFVQTCKEAGGG